MRLIVSTMKDEGPFILEWIAYYLFLGFDHFLICTNDCSDGTDAIIKRLQELGIASHIDNPGPWEFGPQASAYKHAMAHPKYAEAKWVMVCDADEFLDIKVGDHTLDALFEATPATDVYAFIWRLFGHSGVVEFQDKFITEQMTMAALERQIWPPQVRAIKSLVRMDGSYRSISTHRPKHLRTKRKGKVRWTDGDGQRIYGFDVQGWMFSETGNAFGANIARMNHYAVRSIESYLMKRQRGDVNTTSFHSKMEETGQRYWQLHCWNVTEDLSMRAKTDRTREIYEGLRRDKELDTLHLRSVAFHQSEIAKINQTETAVSFKETYKDYRSEKPVSLRIEAICDPSLLLNSEHFDPTTFLRRLQLARLEDIKARHKANLLPWFANMDALEIPIDRDEVQAIHDNLRITGRADAALPEIPQALLHALAAPHEERDARKNRVSRIRKRFLDEMSGRRRKIWLIIGGTDATLIEDVLARKEVRHVYLIEPWGMRPNEMVVETQDIDKQRKNQDQTFIKTVLKHHKEIKSGQLVILRSLPQWILRLLDDDFFDIIYVNGARRRGQSPRLMELMCAKVKPGGLVIYNSYRQSNASGLEMIAMIHEYLGQHPDAWRVMGVDRTHIAIESIKPNAPDS